jgi:hypothetical protein
MRTYEALRLRREAEESRRGSGSKVVTEIMSHPETKVMGRTSLISAYEYVESSFPSAAPAVAAIGVMKNENTAFCRRIGVPRGAGGLFFVDASAILICYNPFPDDIVVVHEMLHFVSQTLGSRFRNVRSEEDFAYSKSIRYLIDKGLSREWIREEYMLPYYVGVEQSHGIPSEEASIAAKSKCDNIIASELGDERLGVPSRIPNRFEML